MGTIALEANYNIIAHHLPNPGGTHPGRLDHCLGSQLQHHCSSSSKPRWDPSRPTRPLPWKPTTTSLLIIFQTQVGPPWVWKMMSNDVVVGFQGNGLVGLDGSHLGLEDDEQ